MPDVWSELHDSYKNQDWIDLPSLFAQEASEYFPDSGHLLDLGAGQGQDSRFYASHGFQVTVADIEVSALRLAEEKTPPELEPRMSFLRLDLYKQLPFPDEKFDVVYAHLSLHYFDLATTRQLFSEIERVLRPGGTLAFLVNSTSDPEHGEGAELEPDFFLDKTKKRYFSVKSAGQLVKSFDIIVLDDAGETYKDRDKGVHNLIRFVGTKPEKRNENGRS